MQAADCPHLIIVFVRGLESVHHQRIKGRVVAIAELRPLPRNVYIAEGGLFGNDVAKRYTIIKGSDFHGEPGTGLGGKIRGEGVVVIADVFRLANRDGIGFVRAALLHIHCARAGTERRQPLQVQTKLRLIDQSLAMESD